MIKVLFEMLHRRVYGLIKPRLPSKKGMGSVVDNRETSVIVQPSHFMPKSFGLGAGIVGFPRDEPNRRI